jgi:hypothetical protein
MWALGEIAVDLVRVYFSEADWLFLVLEQYQFENLHTSWIVASEGVLKQGNIQHLSRKFTVLSCFAISGSRIGSPVPAPKKYKVRKLCGWRRS